MSYGMSLGAGATLSGEVPDRMPLGVALLDDLVGGATALDEACEVSGRMPPHGRWMLVALIVYPKVSHWMKQVVDLIDSPWVQYCWTMVLEQS